MLSLKFESRTVIETIIDKYLRDIGTYTVKISKRALSFSIGTQKVIVHNNTYLLRNQYGTSFPDDVLINDMYVSSKL